MFTKLYLDRYELIDGPLTEALVLAKRQEVRDKLDALLAAASETTSYKIAERHGFWPKAGKYKLSFRPYVSGIRIKYTHIPALLREFGQDSFWDLSEYKAGEQLLGCVNGVKDERDCRVLRMEAGATSSILDYLAQIVDPDWDEIDSIKLLPHSSLDSGGSSSSATHARQQHKNTTAAATKLAETLGLIDSCQGGQHGGA